MKRAITEPTFIISGIIGSIMGSVGGHLAIVFAAGQWPNGADFQELPANCLIGFIIGIVFVPLISVITSSSQSIRYWTLLWVLIGAILGNAILILLLV